MSALRIVRPPSTRGGRAYSPRCGHSPNYLGRLLVFCFFSPFLSAGRRRRLALATIINRDGLRKAAAAAVSFRSSLARRMPQGLFNQCYPRLHCWLTGVLPGLFRSPDPFPPLYNADGPQSRPSILLISLVLGLLSFEIS